MPITIRYTFLTQILCIELELTVNKYGTLVRKNATEAADTPTKVCNKLLFKQKVPQCVDILNKTVVGLLLEKELLVASKDSNIIVNDKTLSEGVNDLVSFKAIKIDLLSAENSSNFQIILLLPVPTHLLFKNIMM